MSVTLTERAAEEVKRVISDQKLEEGTVLRLGVSAGGCSGFSYQFGFDKPLATHVTEAMNKFADNGSTDYDGLAEHANRLWKLGTTAEELKECGNDLTTKLATKAEAADRRYNAHIEVHGVELVVDKKSAPYLDGTTVDFYEGIEKRGFTFDNPNVFKSCGCGSSFQA